MTEAWYVLDGAAGEKAALLALYHLSLGPNALKALREAGEDDLPFLLGWTSPVTSVVHVAGGLFRAYECYPRILLDHGSDDIYLACPQGYDGVHFEPAGSRKLSDEEIAERIDPLFNGGWGDPVMLPTPPMRGVTCPADFAPDRHLVVQNPYIIENEKKICFVPRGRSLEAAEDYRRRESLVEEKAGALFERLKQLILPQQGGQSQPYHLSSSRGLNPGEKPDMRLRLSDKKGNSLEINSNAYFIVSCRQGGSYEILPNRETEEGREIAAAFDDLPENPSWQDYAALIADYAPMRNNAAELFGMRGRIPRLEFLQGILVLVYHADLDAAENFCPTDAVCLPPDMYQWLLMDKEDASRGIELPPLPAEIAALAGVAGPLLPAARLLKAPEGPV